MLTKQSMPRQSQTSNALRLCTHGASGAPRGMVNLRSLDLYGHVGVSHPALSALANLTQLSHLGLGAAQLIFDQQDPEDCPEHMMGQLYGLMEANTGLRSLRWVGMVLVIEGLGGCCSVATLQARLCSLGAFVVGCNVPWQATPMRLLGLRSVFC